jgi:hypothetical protein
MKMPFNLEIVHWSCERMWNLLYSRPFPYKNHENGGGGGGVTILKQLSVFKNMGAISCSGQILCRNLQTTFQLQYTVENHMYHTENGNWRGSCVRTITPVWTILVDFKLFTKIKIEIKHTILLIQFKTLPSLDELVNNYRPDRVWSDEDFGQDVYWKSQEFVARL